MRAYRTTISLSGALAVAFAVSGCNEALVPDFNNLTAFPHSVSSLQNEFTGAFNGVRGDIGFFTESSDGFARLAAYYTPSEERFVTELTGLQVLDVDNFGAGIWDFEFNAVKVADTVISVIPQLRVNGVAVAAANQHALIGVLETIKAMDYMYIAISHDTNGVPINAVGQPISNPAPILCNKDVWKQIVAMLDSAKTDLDAAGAGTALAIPGSKFVLTMPPGYAALGSTAGGFEALTLALRGRAEIEYAYAIARQAGGASAPSVSSAGSPDQTQLTNAIADITASGVYSSTLSAAAANPALDLGVFHSYSGASGDQPSANFGFAASTFVLEGAALQIDTLHDARFTTKWAQAPSRPASPGSAAASTYAMNLNNINISSPVPIVRNLELQFLLARAYLGTGQLLKAAQTVDAVRTGVGGLRTGFIPDTMIGVDRSDTTKRDTTIYTLDPTKYTSVRDFLMREQMVTLMFDGTGDQIPAIRDYGLIMQDLTTWGANDFHTSMENIPVVERQQRNNHFAPVCTS